MSVSSKSAKRQSSFEEQGVAKAGNTENRGDMNLGTEWSYWTHEEATTDWQDGLTFITSMVSFKQYWEQLKLVVLPANMIEGSTYYLFKSDIKPIWESEENKGGGRFMVLLQKNDPFRNFYWIGLINCLVADNLLTELDDICGIVYHRRKDGDKISLWCSNTQDEDFAVDRVKSYLKSELNVDFKCVRYVAHKC